MLVALAGGVGAARFLRGLLRVHPPGDLVVVGNTGDDLRMHGLAVSPDLDSVAYTLAGLADEERGWGLAGETWNVGEALTRLGEPGWFALGDRDIATHLLRTRLLAEGATLSEATAEVCARLGVPVRLLPMSDQPVETRVEVDGPGGPEDLGFQEYWVARKASDPVRARILKRPLATTPPPRTVPCSSPWPAGSAPPGSCAACSASTPPTIWS